MATSELMPVSADPETSAPTGYTLVLPPGWSRIPLRRGTEQAITKVLDRSFAGRPREQVAGLRHELRLRLQELAGRGSGPTMTTFRWRRP
jgi:hypothetical protein